jgi:hypothetical protein
VKSERVKREGMGVECGFRVASTMLVGWRVKRKREIDGNGKGVIMAGIAIPLIFPFFGFSNQPSNV